MNAKKKGNAGENKFANWLVSQDIKAYRNSSSGGNTQKSDIHNSLDANFEVKTVKKINIGKAWQQTVRDATMASSTPYLAIHLDGMPDDTWLMVMSNWDWVELIKSAGKVQIPQNLATSATKDDRELKWATHNAKVAINKLEKLL